MLTSLGFGGIGNRISAPDASRDGFGEAIRGLRLGVVEIRSPCQRFGQIRKSNMEPFPVLLRQETCRIRRREHQRLSLRMPICLNMPVASRGRVLFQVLNDCEPGADVNSAVAPRTAFGRPAVREFVPPRDGFHLPQKFAALRTCIFEHFCSIRNP